MRSTFWPNRIFERQSSQNRHAGLKFSRKRENSAPSMKILHDALFRSCAFLQNRKTVRFPRKLYKTRFSGHAQHVLAKSHFWASKFSKSSAWPEILVKTGKQCTFPMKIVQRSFQVMRSTFWPNRIFERQSSQNRHAGLKFSRKREDSAPSMKILHDALFRSCAFLQNRKTVRFPRKLYKTRFSGHAQHVLAKNAVWPKRAAHDLKGALYNFHGESALFTRFDENFRPRWRFWELWRSKMRFGQNVLRMTWKERCTIFMGKVHCFPVLTRISGQADDFENFDAQKCDFAKTCCAWPEKRVLYNFLGKRTVFLFWRNAHDLKRASCKIFMEGALSSRFRENFRPAWRFWELWRSKMRFGQNVLRMTWKERFVQFSWGKCTVFPFWREFQAKVTILRTLTLKNAIWPKSAAHGLKRGSCTIFMEGALFSRFDENFRPKWRFWELWRSKMWFGQNVLRMTWKERFVQFSWKKCTVFPFWREFQAKLTILRTLTLKNAIWPKRAAHDLKGAFCTIFMEGALFSRFDENFRPKWRFWELWRSKMRFGQNVLRMTWKERFGQFHKKTHCFPDLKRISGQCDDFKNFDALNCAPFFCFQEKRMTWKAHCFFRLEDNLRPVSRFWEICRSKMRFGQNVLRMTWKQRFCTIFMESALFSRFDENFRPRLKLWT